MSEAQESLHFTIEDRILLHLLDFVKMRDDVQVPASITQQGISQGVHIKKKHVPRSLKALKEKDLISERTAHVTGKPQRMKTYSLSRDGEEKARRLRHHIKGISIKVKDGTRNIKEVEVKDLGNLLEGTLSLAEVISYISQDRVFDIEKVRHEREEEQQVTKRDDVAIYRQALAQAWKDGRVSTDEKEMLLILRECLNVSYKEHLVLEEEILENVAKTAHKKVIEVYKVALEQALEDGKVTEDERAILEKIRRRFNIREDGQ
jgi:DNA-binding PadR family transcriptional regulator